MCFGDLNLSDGHILELHSFKEKSVVRFQDWREECWDIVFYDVYAIQDFSAEGSEIGDAAIDDENSLLTMARECIKEDLANCHCYSFKSAWNDVKVLSIVANRFEVKKINS